jgi:hypothetical protein
MVACTWRIVVQPGLGIKRNLISKIARASFVLEGEYGGNTMYSCMKMEK